MDSSIVELSQSESSESESKKVEARRIFNTLKDNYGKATLYDPLSGWIYLENPGSGETSLCTVSYVGDSEISPNWLDGKFTPDELASGIVCIGDLGAPDLLSSQGKGRTLFLSGTGRVIQIDEIHKKPLVSIELKELDENIKNGIRRLGLLSEAPEKILKSFGSYKAFKDALGTSDLGLLDRSGTRPKKGLYSISEKGGLEEYIADMTRAKSGLPLQTWYGDFKEKHLTVFKSFADRLDNNRPKKENVRRTTTHVRRHGN